MSPGRRRAAAAGVALAALGLAALTSCSDDDQDPPEPPATTTSTTTTTTTTSTTSTTTTTLPEGTVEPVGAIVAGQRYTVGSFRPQVTFEMGADLLRGDLVSDDAFGFVYWAESGGGGIFFNRVDAVVDADAVDGLLPSPTQWPVEPVPDDLVAWLEQRGPHVIRSVDQRLVGGAAVPYVEVETTTETYVAAPADVPFTWFEGDVHRFVVLDVDGATVLVGAVAKTATEMASIRPVLEHVLGTLSFE